MHLSACLYTSAHMHQMQSACRETFADFRTLFLTRRHATRRDGVQPPTERTRLYKPCRRRETQDVCAPSLSQCQTGAQVLSNRSAGENKNKQHSVIQSSAKTMCTTLGFQNLVVLHVVGWGKSDFEVSIYVSSRVDCITNHHTA
jgi:hypothetical protein